MTTLYLPHQKLMAGETAVTVFCSQFGGPRVWIEFRGYLLLLEDAGLSLVAGNGYDSSPWAICLALQFFLR